MNKLAKTLVWCLLLTGVAQPVWAQQTVRLVVHKSFSLPKNVIENFENINSVKVEIIKAGNANEMLNKLILSRAQPIGDVVYGLDNNNLAKARQSGILAEAQPSSQPVSHALNGIPAIDYSVVTLNYDKAWFEAHKLKLPETLEDLTRPEYKDLLVVSNPGTSSPGLAFLAANIRALGEEKAFDWWAKMRANGVKVVDSWSKAYYSQYTVGGGNRPMLVGYATTPPAEVFYSEGKYSTPPSGNLFLKGGYGVQVEGAAVLAKTPVPALAKRLTAYLQSPEVQKAIPESMWVYPAVKATQLPESFRFAQSPDNAPVTSTSAEEQKRWVTRWVRTVLH